MAYNIELKNNWYLLPRFNIYWGFSSEFKVPHQDVSSPANCWIIELAIRKKF